LPQEDKDARKVLLTQDLYTIDDTDHRLYRVSVPRAKKERRVKSVELQLCLPKKYQFFVADLLHKTLAHCATERLYLSLKERVYSKDLFHLADSVSKTCSECQQCKRDHRQVINTLHKTRSDQKWAEAWHLDHVSLSRPCKGYKYLLVCIEIYSGYPEVYPVYTTTALETAKCLVDLISRFGLMKTLQTDRGSAFTAQVFREVGKIFGFHHKFASSMAPRSDGRVEKQNQQIKNSLRILCERDDEIVDKLPLVLLAARATVSTVSNVSPYMAVFGRPMPLPVPGCDHDTPAQPYEKMRIAEATFLNKLKQQLDELQVKIQANVEEQKDESKRAYDKMFNAKPIEFNVSDMVWLKDRGPTAHSPSVITHRKYIGPYFVTGVTPQRQGEGKAYFFNSLSYRKTF
jgi:hypothetical protein